MEYHSLISELKLAGVQFEARLHKDEIAQIESTFGFRFPAEIRDFLSCALPVGGMFFNWRDLSPANIQKFHRFFEQMEEAFHFDIEHNGLGNSQSIFAELAQSPKLIPFYGHRCFFDGIDNMPIISFWQPTDVICYAGSFENYLEVEFLKKAPILENIPERMQNTGIWAKLIG